MITDTFIFDDAYDRKWVVDYVTKCWREQGKLVLDAKIISAEVTVRKKKHLKVSLDTLNRKHGLDHVREKILDEVQMLMDLECT